MERGRLRGIPPLGAAIDLLTTMRLPLAQRLRVLPGGMLGASSEIERPNGATIYGALRESLDCTPVEMAARRSAQVNGTKNAVFFGTRSRCCRLCQRIGHSAGRISKPAIPRDRITEAPTGEEPYQLCNVALVSATSASEIGLSPVGLICLPPCIHICEAKCNARRPRRDEFLSSPFLGHPRRFSLAGSYFGCTS